MIDFITYPVTALIVILGWWVVHYFSSKRDRANKKRELVTKHLINAYLILTTEISQRKQFEIRKLEDIVSEIQLFGSVEQVRLVKELVDCLTQKKAIDLDPLINSLRNDLRDELELERIEGTVLWLRQDMGS